MTHSKTALAILAAATARSALSVSSAEARKLFASRAQVHAACESHNGIGWGWNGTGDYACFTKTGWIHCDPNGACDGGRGVATPPRRVSRPSSSLPPPRN
jgi:hypothetical protein